MRHVKRIIILTASIGDGHNAAAGNVREAIEQLDPRSEVIVLDLFQAAYGRLNQVVRAAYLGLVRHAPTLWESVYRLVDATPRLALGGRWGRLRSALESILGEVQPDCVISTYPVYADVIAEIYRDHAQRPFRLLTVVTDSISVNSAWYQSECDLFCVANEPTSEVLLSGGVPRSRVAVTGFPVSPVFQTQELPELEAPVEGKVRRVLYVHSVTSRKIGRMLEEILEIPNTELTVTTGRDAALKAKLGERLAPYGGRVRVFGWTNLMPRLLGTHHVVVTKAGGATVQEAIAARCPLVIYQTIAGQESGNAKLIYQEGYGCVAEGRREAVRCLAESFADDARLWRVWRSRLIRDCRPGAAFRIAELALQDSTLDQGPGVLMPVWEREVAEARTRVSRAAKPPRIERGLLCDFHIHTNYSDGKLTVAEVVDFYGAHGFDCICITDHLADPRRLIGKLVRLSGLTLAPAQLAEYFEVIRREAARAWRRYGMVVMAGIEFNKDGYTRKTSAHLLGVGLSRPIAPNLDLEETIAHIHAQGGLAVASHPHVMKSEWGKNTLYLWENQATFAPLIDAWEIANRDNIFSPVALKRLPFVANSDFHKPRHIYSWKTVLHCEKNPEAITACVRTNQNVSITLYRGREARPRFAEIVRPEFRERVVEKATRDWATVNSRSV